MLPHAARSDSKGDGQAEKVVQSIEVIVRTLFIDLEQRCGEELSAHDELFPWLLEHGCDVNTQDEHGNAAVHEAAWSGFSNTLELLVKYNVNTVITNKVQ